MILKNSFLANLIENNKRRMWVWVIVSITAFLYYPIGFIIQLTRYKSRVVELTPLGNARQHILDGINHYVGLNNGALLAIACVLGFMCAFQGFSYLFSKKKVDLYHSMPVSKTRRFAVIWINGVLINAIPLLAGQVLGFIILFTQGVASLHTLNIALATFVYYLFLYIVIYSITSLAVILTGRPILAVCMSIVLFSYEYFVRILFRSYLQSSFDRYVSDSSSLMPYFSPFHFFAQTAKEWDSIMPWGSLYLGELILFGGCITAIGYICYRRRPSEAAERAIAFSIIKPIVKVAIAIPAALTAAMCVNDFVGPGSFGIKVFVIILTSIITCAIIEAFYASDIRAALKKKRHILITTLGSLLLFFVFWFDLPGFDAYVPKASQIESYAIAIDGQHYLQYNLSYYDKDYNYVNRWEYIKENMYLKDVDTICQLAGNLQEENEKTIGANVLYRLKNGRELCRRVFVNPSDPAVCASLDQIFETQEFKAGYYLIWQDYFGKDSQTTKVISNRTIMYDNGIRQSQLWSDDWDTLVDLYQQDLEKINFTTLKGELALGTLTFEGRITDESALTENTNGMVSYYGPQFCYSVMIYPSCTETLGYLKRLGYYKDADIEAAQVKKIELFYEMSEDKESWESSKGLTYSETVSETTMIGESLDFTAQETIAEIVKVIRAQAYAYANAYHLERQDYYWMNVYFKDGTTGQYAMAVQDAPDCVTKRIKQ